MSIYSWKGNTEEENEVVVFLKTRKTNISKVKEFLKQNHPYEVPAFISYQLLDVKSSYANWIFSEILYGKIFLEK